MNFRNSRFGLISAEIYIPLGLIILSLVPAVGGTFRLAQLAGGPEIIPGDAARFFASPIPVVLHIISVSLYSVLGAFQFAPAFRRKQPHWHRRAGRVLIPAGLIAALTGLWMTQFYPWPEFDGIALYAMRWVVGVSMTLALLLGLLAIRCWDIKQHQAWMIRAYALGMGAGTQVFTFIPMVVFQIELNETTRAVSMGAGWVINAAVAEWVIRRQPSQTKMARRKSRPA